MINSEGRERLIIKSIAFVEDELDHYIENIKIETTKTKIHKRNGNYFNEFIFAIDHFKKIVKNGYSISPDNIKNFIGGTFEYDYKLFEVDSKLSDVKIEEYI